MYKIGDIIDARPDGSYIYNSVDGVKNLDNIKELQEAQREDNARLDSPSLTEREKQKGYDLSVC